MRQLNLENEFFSDLSVDRDPVGSSLVDDLRSIELLKSESDLIGESEDELPFQPFIDLFVFLARHSAIRLIFNLLTALLESDLELARLC